MATFPLLHARLEELALGGAPLAIVVDRLQDGGNVGTIIRTADAAGAAAVVLVAPCADPHDPKVVRGSMGSLFQVPVVETEDGCGALRRLAERGLRVVGTTARGGIPLAEAPLGGGVALVFGNESRGVSDDLRNAVSAWVSLPMPGRAESLNVAVAAGVLMYAWLARNPATKPNA